MSIPLEYGDSITTAIWKLMQDYKARTSRQIRDMLIRYGYPAKQTQVKVAVLVKKGWFISIDDDTNFKKASSYKLKTSISKPKNIQKLNYFGAA